MLSGGCKEAKNQSTMVNFNDKEQGILFLSSCFYKLIQSSPNQPRQTLCTFCHALKHAYLLGHVYNVMKVDTRITYNYLVIVPVLGSRFKKERNKI